MDLTLVKIEIPQKWELTDSSPNRLIYKSPYIEDPYCSIEIINDNGKIYGLIKSCENQNGSQVLLGRGLSVEILLMFMISFKTENIFDINDLEE